MLVAIHFLMKIIGVTAPSTDSGKTSITLALLSKLRNSTAIKIGPDYIDGGLSSRITGNVTWNMDRWIQGRNYARVFQHLAGRYDYAVVEGVMGMYDSGSQIDLSTHYYFQRLKIPYIVVIDVSKLAESAYHIAKGFLGKLNLGVIINKYGSEKHLKMVADEFKKHGVNVLGAIPTEKSYSIPQRHLGLHTSFEINNLRSIANEISKNIDFSFVEKLMDIKVEGKPLETPHFTRTRRNLRISIALDKAFNFYYADSIHALSSLGKIEYFSPLNGDIPENPDFIYIGGGYPELYAEELSKKTSLLKFLRDYSESGKPMLGECGGLMYMEKDMITEKGKANMAGIFDGRVNHNSGLTLGYTKLRSRRESILFRRGEIVYGHEFHYSTISDGSKKVLQNILGKGIDGEDGIQRNNTLGTYSHFSLYRYFNRLSRAINNNL